MSVSVMGGGGAKMRGSHVRIMREIMDVPFPLAASRRLMSFLTFQISIYRQTTC